MSLVTSNSLITAGIVNIPLTYPAKVYFKCKNIEDFELIKYLFNQFGIEYHLDDIDKIHLVRSYNTIDKQKLIALFALTNNGLRPHVISEYRYLFWEIDNHSEIILDYVLSIYKKNNLPVYYHKTTKGYHFFCVKPIKHEEWKRLIPILRQFGIVSTNPNYPPLTLRVKANKYINELEYFKQSGFALPASHSDTISLARMIENQDFDKLQKHYYFVWYPI